MTTYLRGLILVSPEHGPSSQPTDVTLEGGVLSAIGGAVRVGPEDQVIELDGRYATPGLVNAHDHLYSHELRHPLPGWGLAQMRAWIDARDEISTLAVMLRTALDSLTKGITTVRDLGARHGANTALDRMLHDAGLIGPTIVPAGRPIVMTGGHVWGFGRESDGPWSCRQAVREQVKAGARVIKIMASGGLSHYPDEDFGLPQFTVEELRAIVDEAHAAGLPATAHAFGSDAVHRAVLAGIDCIEHGVEIDDETLDLMVAQGTSYVPTLANMRRIASQEFSQNAGVPERAKILMRNIVAPHRRTFQRALEAGVRIGVGTDSTGTYQEELEAMAEYGMDLPAMLTAAWATGADICRQPSGRLQIGQRADLALYDTLPQKPADLIRPAMVCSGGRLVSTEEIRRLLGVEGVVS